MSRTIRTLALALALLFVLTLLPTPRFALAESDGMVRVKITRIGSATSLKFTTSAAYFIDNDSSRKIPSGSVVTVSLSGGKLTLKGGSESVSGSSITINRSRAGTGGVKFTSPALANVFCGDMRFTASSGVIQLVMTTYVEDYLYGVVGYEMSNSYPLDALKAQAIAARNYVLRAKAARADRDYDVVDNTNDQVYKGYNSSYANVIKAVDQTRGMALYYGSAIAACYYGASNGGQTESTKNAWGSSLAYSVVKDDRYDLESGATSKSVTFAKDLTGKTLNSNLKNALVAGMSDTLSSHNLSAADVTIDKIVSIEPIKPKYASPSRLYTYLRFTVKATTLDANGQKVSGKVAVEIPTYSGLESWYALSINSSANETVWVDETDSSITVTFRRWGHGIGMSQRGAKVMAQDYSMDFNAILYFYYPGTALQTLNLKDRTGDGMDGGDPDEEPAPTGQAAIKLSNPKSTLNLRAKASTSAKILTRLNHGTIVDVYGTSGQWTAIGYKTHRGYVMTKYLARVDTAPTPTPTPAPTGGTSPTASPSPAPTVQPTPTPNAVYGMVKLSSSSSRLRIRKSTSTSSKIVGYLKNKNVVRVLALKGSWVRIQTPAGLKGYVQKKYLKKVNVSTKAFEAFQSGKIPASAIAAVANVNTFVYQSASLSAAAVAGITKGDRCYVLAYSSAWAYVTYGGFEGFVPIGNIRKAD